ncbi:carbohydrate ABC transporter permease [Pseudomonas helleri]|jgi:glucose/mannose transport system permease protein|uniref:ABC transporter permease subunit n=1 Tax=Pseudomonas helleri TaxID=1608996 RepID=A0A6I1WKG0_9PSED|nr:sugar ABC transporter permease [Pseudomonas helleri]MQU41967.1 ABC transporter permease subunit [Pseudomonas helleri]
MRPTPSRLPHAADAEPLRRSKKTPWSPAALAIAPTFILVAISVYGFIGWTTIISFTKSRYFPEYDFVGLSQYVRLWESDRWNTSVINLVLFSIGFALISLLIGLLIAIFLDQKIRAENTLRMIYLYPMAISLIVTGIAWKWILNPGTGIEHLLRSWGWESASFNWLVDPKMAVYTLVIAAVWQTAGFIMAIFLAGLRGVDSEIVKAAQLEGAGLFRIYTVIIIPMLRPAMFSAIIILIYQAVRSFDLVVALTNGGPGYSSDLPTTFMYNSTFLRGQMAQGSASAVMILLVVVAIVVPYLYAEFKREHNDSSH